MYIASFESISNKKSASSNDSFDMLFILNNLRKNDKPVHNFSIHRCLKWHKHKTTFLCFLLNEISEMRGNGRMRRLR